MPTKHTTPHRTADNTADQGVTRVVAAPEDPPSQFKNNLDQLTQPTRDGGFAGGTIPPVGGTGNEAPETTPTEAAKQRQERIRLGEQANSRVDMTPNRATAADVGAAAVVKTNLATGEITVPHSGNKMVQMKLERNYVPRGDYEIVGEAEKAPLAGTGTKGKLWAGTTVNLPADEAREVLKAGIGSRGDDF